VVHVLEARFYISMKNIFNQPKLLSCVSIAVLYNIFVNKMDWQTIPHMHMKLFPSLKLGMNCGLGGSNIVFVNMKLIYFLTWPYIIGKSGDNK
jgi:hypothetical protein